MKLASSLTIFEGPDGGGKTTIALAYAKATGAKYVHHGSYATLAPKELGRVYADSFLAALRGKQAVVLDRSWLSEPLYANVFRSGRDRVGPASARFLDRLALRCAVTTVLCLPPWATVRRGAVERPADEHHGDLAKLRRVYQLYTNARFTLPTVRYDFTQQGNSLGLATLDRTPPHPVRWQAGGSLAAQVVLVGDSFGRRGRYDPVTRWPFSTFSGNGCSAWLAAQLDVVGVSERQLFWVNADHPKLVTVLAAVPAASVICLGQRAARAVPGAPSVPHPQYWKRFRYREEYPLVPLLRRLAC